MQLVDINLTNRISELLVLVVLKTNKPIMLIIADLVLNEFTNDVELFNYLTWYVDSLNKEDYEINKHDVELEMLYK